jgi:hypothetical protein
VATAAAAATIVVDDSERVLVFCCDLVETSTKIDLVLVFNGAHDEHQSTKIAVFFRLVLLAEKGR